MAGQRQDEHRGQDGGAGPFVSRHVCMRHRRMAMASEQANEMAQRYASVTERTSRPDLDLPTRRDIDESLHSAAREPERVSYAEVDADGVPALWCIPEDS